MDAGKELARHAPQSIKRIPSTSRHPVPYGAAAASAPLDAAPRGAGPPPVRSTPCAVIARAGWSWTQEAQSMSSMWHGARGGCCVRCAQVCVRMRRTFPTASLSMCVDGTVPRTPRTRRRRRRARKIFKVFWREKRKLHFHALAPLPPPPPPVDPPTMALLFRRAFATTAPNLAVKNVTVYGSGLMGSGIVQVRRAEAHRGRTTAQSADVGRCVRRAGRPRMRADCRGRGLQGHHGRRQRRRPQEGPQPHREEPAGTLPRPCQSALNTPAAALTRAPARRRAVYAAPAPSVWPTKNSRTSRPTRRST